MKTRKLFLVPAAVLGALVVAAGPAAAEDGTWQAELAPANNSGTSGSVMVEVHGSEATVHMSVTGAAETWRGAPFPHTQHIHVGGQGVCAGPESDSDGDGVVSSPEGAPLTGHISTSLTISGDTSPASAVAVDRFPGGGSYSYERTVILDPETMAALQAGTAAVEMHGVDPALLPAAAQQKTSPEDPSLPLAATLPAACGVLMPSQLDGMPRGGAAAGVEVDTAAQGAAAYTAPGAGAALGAAGLAAALAAGAAGAAAAGKRRAARRS
ncbi:hypothetical protein [Arthrobacter sp. zg-Y750]|uniref:hypothetical protein n=1 Tax=Arthrobacter sp. zg-Y750 TaxID=2894189 RepID=UPI001E358A72|nr:hypothetical protein [Arthrobacter sp. zg-Y750]MCC9178541.1 hypothetical protein [Arthrobacter sp. zg-Y750]